MLAPAPQPARKPGAGFRLPADDPEMNAAFTRAQSTVAEFITRFTNSLPTDTRFSVKVLAQDGTEVEHFWLSDLSYTNGTFTGKIANEPESVRTVTFGQQVALPEKEILDWMYLANGKLIGNETLRVLMTRMPKAKADRIREQYQMTD